MSIHQILNSPAPTWNGLRTVNEKIQSLNIIPTALKVYYTGLKKKVLFTHTIIDLQSCSKITRTLDITEIKRSVIEYIANLDANGPEERKNYAAAVSLLNKLDELTAVEPKSRSFWEKLLIAIAKFLERFDAATRKEKQLKNDLKSLRVLYLNENINMFKELIELLPESPKVKTFNGNIKLLSLELLQLC